MGQPRLPCLARIAARSIATGWVAATYGGLYVYATGDIAGSGAAWIFTWPFLAVLFVVTAVHLYLAGVGGARLPSPIGWVNTINRLLAPGVRTDEAPRDALETALVWLPVVPAANALCAMVLAGATTATMGLLASLTAAGRAQVGATLFGGCIATLLYGATSFAAGEALVSRPCRRLRSAAMRRGLDLYVGPTVQTWVRVATLVAPMMLTLVVAARLLADLEGAVLVQLSTFVLAGVLVTALAWLQAIAVRAAAEDLGAAAGRMARAEDARLVTGTIDAHLTRLADSFNEAAKEVDRSLQNSAARYASLFEGAGDAILLVDVATGEVVEANRRAAELTLLSDAELRGRAFDSLFKPGRRVENVRREASGTYREEGALVLRADGSECAVDIALSLLAVDDRTILQAILHDMSERVRIEEALRESVERIEGLYHLALTLGGTVEQVADHIAGTLPTLLDVPMVGVARREGDGLRMLALYENGAVSRGRHRPLAATPCERVCATGTLHAFTDVREAFPDDAFLAARGIRMYVAAPVVARDGNVVGMVAVMDTTPRSLEDHDLRLIRTFAGRLARAFHEEEYVRERDAFVEQLTSQNVELRAAQERLTESDRLKSEFMGMMSHELRTPLNIFTGYTEMLVDAVREQGGAPPADHEDVLMRMLDAARVLTSLVDDTLSVLRLESAGVRVHKEDVSLAALFGELRAAERFLRTPRQVQERWEIADDLPALSSDRLKLRQIFTNLIGNARKFTHEGSITVRAVRAGPETIAVTVTDTGCGIAADHLPHIFDLYRQAPSSQDAAGCGIGLYIVRRYCELLGGAVEVTSEVGRGTAFTVTLPAAPPPAATTASAPAAAHA